MNRMVCTVPGTVHEVDAYKSYLKNGVETLAECQDNVCVLSRKGITAACLCDGAGSYKMAATGSRVMSENIARWLLRDYYVLKKASNDLIVASAAITIWKTMQELSEEYQLPPEEFSSTLVACVTDEKNNQTITLHLGDGIIISCSDYDQCCGVSLPENGTYSYTTWLTSCDIPEILDHLRVQRIRSDRMIMLSDGASGTLYSNDGECISHTLAYLANELKCTGNSDGMRDWVESMVRDQLRLSDDFSIVILAAPHSALDRQRQSTKARAHGKERTFFFAREAGISERDAARQAGWAKRTLRRKLYGGSSVLSQSVI